MRIIIFGPPGAGKGTQAKLIEAHYNIAHLSTGEIFRTAIKKQTELGKKIESIMENGELVPDETTVALVKEELQQVKYEPGYILDGFPRTVPQAEAFDNYLQEQEVKLDSFLVLEVPEEELVERILSRSEGRSDDNEESVRKRLQVYHEETQPVIDHYEEQGLVQRVEGRGGINEIFTRIKLKLDQAKFKGGPFFKV